MQNALRVGVKTMTPLTGDRKKRKDPSEKFMARPSRRAKLKARISASFEARIAELEKKCVDLDLALQRTRAQMCQLRVVQEKIHERLGYMVGAFIPEGTVAKLRSWTPEQREEFKRAVVDALVANALNGVVRINSRGKMTAMVFLPPGVGGEILEIFETDLKQFEEGGVHRHLAEHKRKTLQIMPPPDRLLLNEKSDV